ncbi:MAG: AMP-binding protein [Oscillospiraceae bacterium]|nr:AMP-binding protein [Oscillospiraceae bacterium]
MDKKIKEIAQRVKELREIEGLTPSQMAEKIGVSEAEYSQLESGKSDFTFTFIYKCAKVCGVDIVDILKGHSPSLSAYQVNRNGEGLEIARRKGFKYFNLASNFKNRVCEPFKVHMPYSAEEQGSEIHTNTHKGQEMDIVLKGSMRVRLGDHYEDLNEGDSIYYDSLIPHGMIATSEEGCDMYALVFENAFAQYEEEEQTVEVERHDYSGSVADNFIKTTEDENGTIQTIDFVNEDKFNFGFDVVDAVAKKTPDKLAMLHISNDKTERRFTFGDIAKYSAKTANYFESLGIKKGDRVMLVLKRHYQFWFSIVALHKIGAIVIPATNQLVAHDFDYRFKAAGVKAIICTADGDTANQADIASKECPDLTVKVIVNGKKEGWNCFDEEVEKFSDVYERREDTACGDDHMLMFFTSGTTGYPKIAVHNFKYPLGHFITARHWHYVDPDGLHFTISDTGWGKALWGKLYGQWLCEGAVFTYDFERFHAEDLLPMFKKYNITTFCAPPTMYRFFIKEDLSKYDLSSIKYANTAGEALNPEVFHQFKKATGLSIMEGFGQTETTLTIGNFFGTTPKVGSMGKPSPLYDIDIVNPEGQPVKLGETGEIVVRTDKNIPCGLFCGYYNDEEKTKAVWHDGMYHTGDTAWRDEDGYFWYVGRVDDLIKSSGYRIGPFEIESVVMELPYVLECAVTAVPDPVRGQAVKATIVLTKGTEGTEELKKEIQQYVKKNTAPYKYPRVVEFRDELPKTISGKIKRFEIK